MENKKHKFIVTGASGKIGSEFISLLKKEEYIAISRNSDKLEQDENILQADLSLKNPLPPLLEYDVVVHFAAETHIDHCEAQKDKGKKSDAWINNVCVTENISKYCVKYNKKLVMLSTESVFGGNKKKYSELDKPQPRSWYGVTKLEAEKSVQNNLTNYVILRTVMAYGGKSNKMDLTKLIYNKFKNKNTVYLATDQNIAFTYIYDIFSALMLTVQKEVRGIYHFCGDDVLTPYELGKLIAKTFDFNGKYVIPKTLLELHGPENARLRLKNAVLHDQKFEKEVGIVDKTSIVKGLRKTFNIIL